jgi:serine/threonine protein kinase
MSDIRYEFIMSQIKHIRDIKENEKTKISLVYYEGCQETCILKICKNRDLSEVYQALMEIRHPNVAQVYDCIYENSDTYVIEEFISGKTLADILEEKGPFSEKETAEIITKLCDGLDVLHRQNPPIIHNDIKTSNIMIKEDGIVKLFDFDISRIYKEGSYKNTRLMGTYEYAAPEHYGFGQSDPRTDIYSLGVTMHEMLMGVGLDQEHNITYKGGLAKILRKCVEIDRKKRYASAFILKRALRRYQLLHGKACKGVLIGVIAVLLFALSSIWWMNGRSTGQWLPEMPEHEKSESEVQTEDNIEVDSEVQTEDNIEVDSEVQTEVHEEPDTEDDTKINTEVNSELDIKEEPSNKSEINNNSSKEEETTEEINPEYTKYDSVVNSYFGRWYLEGYKDVYIDIKKNAYINGSSMGVTSNNFTFPGMDEPIPGYSIYPSKLMRELGLEGTYSICFEILYSAWEEGLDDNKMVLADDCILINDFKFVRTQGAIDRYYGTCYREAIGTWYLEDNPNSYIEIFVFEDQPESETDTAVFGINTIRFDFETFETNYSYYVGHGYADMNSEWEKYGISISDGVLTVTNENGSRSFRKYRSLE